MARGMGQVLDHLPRPNGPAVLRIARIPADAGTARAGLAAMLLAGILCLAVPVHAARAAPLPAAGTEAAGKSEARARAGARIEPQPGAEGAAADDGRRETRRDKAGNDTASPAASGAAFRSGSDAGPEAPGSQDARAPDARSQDAGSQDAGSQDTGSRNLGSQATGVQATGSQIPASEISAPQAPGSRFAGAPLAGDAAAETTGSVRPTAAPQPAPGPAASPAIAREARLAGDARRTRLVIDMDRAAPFHVFALADPYRVILDLTDLTFALPADAAPLRRGLVSAARYGVFAPGKARMVLDVTEPVAIDKAFLLDAVDDQPARLVLDVVKTDPESFARTVAALALATPERPAPSPPPAADDARPLIVLDPGHGGIDSGTTGQSAFNEKAIVLETALALRDKLLATGLYRVSLTRTTDTFVALGERVRMARAQRADLFISLHADALAGHDGQARGASVYTLSDQASDADAAHLAEKENKADLIAGLDLSDENDEVAGILVDLAKRETRHFSAQFARTLVGQLKGAVRTHRTPLKSAGFRVLRAHDVPSVLLELGYMSNPEDLKLLTSDAWRAQVTDAAMKAIGEFFAPRRMAGTLAPGAVPPGASAVSGR